MAELRREYVVPLRRKTRFAPKWRRSKKAVSVLKDFIKKHMKTDNVVICAELNEAIWDRGIKNPPGKVSVVALKTQIAGEEKTLVNLAEVGLDAQLELYKTEDIAVPQESEVEEKTQEVKDAEVTEVKSEEKSEKTEKKEVKKDE